jgi:hypothetical protein
VIDPRQKCAAQNPERPVGWTLVRYPTCNRPSGYGGQHREYDPASARVRAEWTGAREVRARRQTTRIARA